MQTKSLEQIIDAAQLRTHEANVEAYRAGVRHGLRTASQIRDWLTRQPDRQWQKKVREMADKVIEKTKMENGIE